MATYKLIQDIEAEDHILGPLTLRQFIYGLVAAFLYYISFVVITKHVTILLVLFLPFALFLTFFAFPFRRDQPTEVWALAKLRFLVKPRKRIWSQSGIKNLVTITVPKKIEQHLTNGLSETEVQNRLKTLALTIDTRGWAVKNMVQAPEQDINQPVDDSDRLINPGSIPKPVPEYDVTRQEDMLDDLSPQSIHLSDAITQSEKSHRQQLISTMGNIRLQNQQEVNQVDKTSEADLIKTLKDRNVTNGLSTSHMHRIEKTDLNKPIPPKPQPTKPNHINPAILNFALNNNGLSVQSLANEAKTSSSDNEVVVNLH